MSINVLSHVSHRNLPGKYRSSVNTLKQQDVYAKTKILSFQDEAEYCKLDRNVCKVSQLGDIIQKLGQSNCRPSVAH